MSILSLCHAGSQMKISHIPAALFWCLLIVAGGCQRQPRGELTLRDGITLRYTDSGESDLVFVLVHGWGNDRTVWTEQIPYLGSKYRVIALDLPGYGQSGYNRENWSMEAFSQDLLEVIDQLKLENVVLVGFSMGAGPCVEAAATGNNAIKALVLVDSLKNPELVFSQEFIDQNRQEMMLLVDNVARDFPDKPNAFFQNRTVQARELVINMMSSGINRERKGWPECLEQFFHWCNGKCVLAMKRIEVPLVGVFSQTEPVNQEFFNNQVKDSELHYIKDSGHVVMWDDSVEFHRILDQLAARLQ